MKRLLKYLFVVLIIVAMGSCAQEEAPKPKPIPEKPHSYTIMCYACCGGLDYDFGQMLEQVSTLNIPRHINVVGQVKWTKNLDTEFSDESGGVSRFVYGRNNSNFMFEEFEQIDYHVNDPRNIAAFISWAQKRAPADEYILLLFGHGNAYNPDSDAMTRGTLYDDYHRSYTSVGELAEALELADTHFSLVYMVSCMMNAMEYLSELAPYTDYTLSSSHVTFTSFAEIQLLVDGLMQYGQSGEDAIPQSVEYAVSEEFRLYYTEDIYVSDKILMDSNNIAELNAEIRGFIDMVCAFYDEQGQIGEAAMLEKYQFTTSDIDEALVSSYDFLKVFMESYYGQSWYSSMYNRDLVDVVSRVASATQDVKLIESAESVRNAAEIAIVYRVTSFVQGVDNVYPSVTLVSRDEWKELGFDEANYEALVFDRATGWSRLLKRNNAIYDR